MFITDGIEFPILRYEIPDIPPRADARELVAVMVPGLMKNKRLDSCLAQLDTGFSAVINKELQTLLMDMVRFPVVFPHSGDLDGLAG